MIKHCGSVWGLRGSSYIYVIFTDNYAYIGETGELPPQRWGSHLSKANSSFSDKLNSTLKKKGEDEYDGIFLYVGLYCEVIDREDLSKRKFARKAIEHEIHRKFISNLNKFGQRRHLLSTSSAISSRINLGFDVESFADRAMEIIVEKYNESLHEINSLLLFSFK